MITQRPKGTQDWYGPDMYKRTVIEDIARRLCKRYHIKEIITPVFEHTILFQRGGKQPMWSKRRCIPFRIKEIVASP